MPLLLSLALHNAQAAVKAQLIEREFLFAFLEDVYVVAQAEIWFICYFSGTRLHEGAGIQLHEGKNSNVGIVEDCAQWMEELGRDVLEPMRCENFGRPHG